MIIYKRGDIVLVPFPFSDQTTIKKRPAVVISSDRYNDISPDVIIMAITSQIGHISEIGEYIITEWQGAGLLKPSAVKSAVSTIEQRLVMKKMGSLTPNDLSSLNQSLKNLLDIN